jgi:hypothetical protein
MRDDQLVEDLVDLGAALDVPAGDGLSVAVANRLRAEPRRGRAGGRRPLLAAAAVVLLFLGLTMVVPPARRAMADLFGIGAVVLRTDDGTGLPPGARPVPGGSVPAGPVDRERLQAAVAFPLRLPTDPAAGEPAGAEVDLRPPGGLVVVGYPSFTLVQVASAEDAPGSVAKTIGVGAKVEHVLVGAAQGWWIDGPHSVAYVDRNGVLQHDTVRQAGPVLLWAVDGVTYRIEGLSDRTQAERVAASLR